MSQSTLTTSSYDGAPAALLDDLLRAAGDAVPQVLAGQFPGHDALHLLRALELGRDLSQQLAALAQDAAAPPRDRNAFSAIRRSALRALKTIAGAEPFTQVYRAWQKGSPEERARLLERLADDLQSLTHGVPANVAAHFGVTPEVLSGLRDEARALHRQSVENAIAALADQIRRELARLGLAQAKAGSPLPA